jgi:orotidine-5'-phosphate decarboxylase
MVTSYNQQLIQMAEARKSILCFGLDPVEERLPASVGGTLRERIVKFYSTIIDALPADGQSVSALKPNYAYFAQYGWDGLQALGELMDRYRGKYALIFDGKRGDIGASSAAYAREAFNFWGADAITISPLMGEDSVRPFLDCMPAGKGVYVLCRTSNAGAADFLAAELAIDEKPLYLSILRKAVQWGAETGGAPGLVVGATDTADLEKVLWEIERTGQAVPLLVPGVGAQGGSALEVGKCLRETLRAQLKLQRINASSSIAYAYQKAKTDDYAGAALNEIATLNRAIGPLV